MRSYDLLREYIRAIAFPASNVKHKIFLYRAQSEFPYRVFKDNSDNIPDSENKDTLEEDDMIYILKSKSSKNTAGSKRGWSSPFVPLVSKKKKKDYFTLKSLVNINKKF